MAAPAPAADVLTKEALIDRVSKLEGVINEALKKVAGHLSIVDDAEVAVLKVQAVLLKTLTDTLGGLPIVGDLLLPSLQKTLEGIENTVDATVKRIEAIIVGQGTTAAPVVTTIAKISTRPVVATTH